MERRDFLKVGGSAFLGALLGLNSDAIGEYTTEHPQIASKYITPENELVQQYAEDAEIEEEWLVFEDPPEWQYIKDAKHFKDAEEYQTPEEYLKDGMGDCEDHSFAMTSILEAMGFEAKVAFGYLDGFNGHTVTEFEYKGERKWMTVDEPQLIQDPEDIDFTKVYSVSD